MIWFDLFILVAAGVYLFLIRFIRNKYTDPKKVKELSEKLRKLAEEVKKNEHNKRKLDHIYEEQQRIMGEMNKEIIRNILITFGVLTIFFLFTWMLGAVDPYIKDDIHANLVDDGSECDEYAGDMNYSYCFIPEREGTYKITLLGDKTDELKLVYLKDEPIPLNQRWSGATVEPSSITEPQKVMITAPYNSSINIDSATRATWVLPFTIPVLNIHTIYEPTWLFIFSTFIVNIAFSIFEVIKKVFAKK